MDSQVRTEQDQLKDLGHLGAFPTGGTGEHHIPRAKAFEQAAHEPKLAIAFASAWPHSAPRRWPGQSPCPAGPAQSLSREPGCRAGDNGPGSPGYRASTASPAPDTAARRDRAGLREDGWSASYTLPVCPGAATCLCLPALGTYARAGYRTARVSAMRGKPTTNPCIDGCRAGLVGPGGSAPIDDATSATDAPGKTSISVGYELPLSPVCAPSGWRKVVISSSSALTAASASRARRH